MFRIAAVVAFAAAQTVSSPLFAEGAHGSHNAHAAHGTHHEAHAAAPATGKKWVADAPLKKGMEAIQAAVKGLSSASSRSEFEKASRMIDAELTGIFKNCKLQPEADAALHVPLSKIIAASKELSAKDGKARQHALDKIHLALGDYAELFDHPGFPAGQ